MALSQSASISLSVAFVLAVYGAVSLLASRNGLVPVLAVTGRRSVFAVAGLVTYAAFALCSLLVMHDFRVAYVAEVTNRAMSVPELLSAFWGGQPGSLLLWAWTLAVFTVGVTAAHWKRYPLLMPSVLAVLLVIEAFFLLVLSLAASPFTQLSLPLPDGQGLNPLLLDPAMRVHPFLVLTGYMSFSVPFAFALGALLSGRVRTEWLRPVRRWTILAWAIQGMGLLAGAWWAYHVLGWGGYWGWDPVENVALLPWLTSTALLHSLMVQEKRGMLKLWNLALVIATFALSIFGTFIVRSGIITSVHSFATSAVGPYFFAFLGLILLVSIALLFYRLPDLSADASMDALLSRESAFVLNNLLLVAIAAATFWGTIFPIVWEAVNGAKIAVGAPFYQKVNTPLLLVLLILMGIGPLLGWRRTSPHRLVVHLRIPLLLAALVGIAMVALGITQALAVLAFAACAFVAGTIGVEYDRGIRARRRSGETLVIAIHTLISRDRRRYGGYLVHLAMLFIAVGIIGSMAFQESREATVEPGQVLHVGRYGLLNGGVTARQRPGMQAVAGSVPVFVGDRQIALLQPERRLYANWEKQPITSVAIATTFPWMEDVYVLMNGLDDRGVMSVRVYINPLVSFIWFGGVLFLLSTIITAWPSARPSRNSNLPATQREAAHSEA